MGRGKKRDKLRATPLVASAADLRHSATPPQAQITPPVVKVAFQEQVEPTAIDLEAWIAHYEKVDDMEGSWALLPDLWKMLGQPEPSLDESKQAHWDVREILRQRGLLGNEDVHIHLKDIDGDSYDLETLPLDKVAAVTPELKAAYEELRARLGKVEVWVRTEEDPTRSTHSAWALDHEFDGADPEAEYRIGVSGIGNRRRAATAVTRDWLLAKPR
jgi:hypothetical protein